MTPDFGNTLAAGFIVQQPPGSISIYPAAGAPGTSFAMRVDGVNLTGVTGVGFTGIGVTATLLPPGSLPDVVMLVQVTVAPDATPGPRTFNVTSLAGTTSWPDMFTVRSARVSTNPQPAPLPILEVEQGTVQTGYAVIACNCFAWTPVVHETLGMVRNGTAISRASISGSVPLYTTAVLAANHSKDLDRSFGVSIVNASSQQNDIRVILIDEGGTPLTNSATVTLGPFMQVSRYISEMFPADSLGTAVRGSLVLQGAQAFTAIGLDFSGSSVSPLGAAVMFSTVNWETPLHPLPANPNQIRQRAVIVPQFAMGGGWASQISIVNPIDAPMSGQVAFFDSNGRPVGVTMNGLTASTFNFNLPVAGSFLLAPRDANGQTPF
jgi:hypothetical protein